MSIVSQAFPNWQLGARSSQAAMDALYFITTIQQQNPNAKSFVYAQGLGTLVANQMAAALPTATWPSAPKAKVDGWILDSVRYFPFTNHFVRVNLFSPHYTLSGIASL
jgi:alpha-beta hydrolase superfamily lysophospholipase